MALLTCLSLAAGGLQVSPKQVKAASQFTGTHFAMEFNGYDSANMEKSNGWSNGGMFNCTWVDSNVNFSSDGIMSLSINSNGSGGYTGGEYRTRQTFGYGMYQVNMKPIKNPGVVTSFFTYTGPTDGTIWDEIDIEFLGYDTTKVQFNYFTNGVGGHEYIHNLGFDASQEFHTYGFYWGAGTITWYVDGVAVYTVNSSDVPVTPGKIMMNAWPGTGVDDWLQPYNGVTPLTGYYDWAVYDAPGSDGGTTTTTQAPTTTTQATTTAASTLPNGYTWANSNWNNFNYWSLYLAPDWGGNPTASYKNGNSYSDFAVNINSASNSDWAIQLKTQAMSVEAGKKYKCKVNVNSDMSTSGQILFKEESTSAQVVQTLNSGNNTFELEFTADSTAQFFFNLGQTPTGLDFKITSFSLEKIEEETVAPTEAATEVPTVSSDTSWTAVDNSSSLFYANANNITVVNVQSPAWAVTSGVYMYTTEGVSYVSINGTQVGSEAAAIDGAGVVVYESVLATGISYVTYHRADGSVIASVAIKKDATTIVETTTEEPATEEETTTIINTTDNGIEVNGYQVSATAKGIRTVYSIEDTIDGKDVVSSGIIYSLSDYADASKLYVGSTSEYVRSYESTSAGKSDTCFSDSDTATSYVMTMIFAGSGATEYNAGWRIRAYALLSDGTYVYTDTYEYTIYDIADKLYQDCMMNTKSAHDYLYTDILLKVDEAYKEKDYNWNNSLARI